MLMYFSVRAPNVTAVKLQVAMLTIQRYSWSSLSMEFEDTQSNKDDLNLVILDENKLFFFNVTLFVKDCKLQIFISLIVALSREIVWLQYTIKKYHTLCVLLV